MKKWSIIIVFFISFQFFAQSNKEIAIVYFDRASSYYNNNNLKKSINDFNKAIKLIDSIKQPENASLGALLNYRLENYKESKKYISNYFRIVIDKKSIVYRTMLELFITIEDKEEQIKELKKKEKELKFKKEKELKKIDSLTIVWGDKVKSFEIEADTIYPFTKYKTALYKKNNSYGVINDQGEIVFYDEKYVNAIQFDGYFLLLNDFEYPSKVYCINNKTSREFELPEIKVFNPSSTYYHKIMYPRGNGTLVMYPNNSTEAIFYDLNNEKLLTTLDENTFLKRLKAANIIEKYRKNNEIRFLNDWYTLGGYSLGGGIFPVYNTNQILEGYIFSIPKKQFFKSEDYQYIGAYYNEKLQVVTENETFWIMQDGSKTETAKDEAFSYNGTSEILKYKKGKYFICKIENSNKTIVKGNKQIITLKDFIKKHK